MRSGTITKRLKISGLVQGIGFRYSFVFAAKRLGIAGWVRNRRDGSVEAVVQGDPRDVQEIIDWAGKGPDMAEVSSVEVTDESGAFEGFDVRETV